MRRHLLQMTVLAAILTLTGCGKHGADETRSASRDRRADRRHARGRYLVA
jgi:hypothetical protein